MTTCKDCPRECAANREKTVGYCGIGRYARIAKIVDPFTYEEPCLGRLAAVFFGGCNLRCSYCQNIEISAAACGKEYSDGELAALFDGISENVGLDIVTPTPHLSAIERAMALCKTKRVVYNTSGYESEDGVKRASCFTDVFLTDLKYVSSELSARFSSAPDYYKRAIAAIRLMRKTRDEWGQEDGRRVLKRGLVVRHLVLPGCTADSMRALDEIKYELGTDTVISLMSQFTPNGRGEPSGRLKPLEYKLVCEHALKLGFTNGYFQDMSSAKSEYTPDFSTEAGD